MTIRWLERVDTSVPCVVICPGYHGHGAARSLGRQGVTVYGVHADSRSPSARSRYWEKSFLWDLSEHSAERSVEWFLRLARRIGYRPILVPTDDDSCLFIEDHADLLEQEYLFPRRPPGLARSLANKERLYALCRQHGVPTPMTVFPKCRRDVEVFIEDASFPVMLKGIDTVALQHRVGVRMVLAKDADSLLRHYDAMEAPDAPNLMLQEYIPGGTENVWMFNGYFDENSDCVFGITGRKLRQYPAYTGMTSLGICERNEALLDQVKGFMKSIGYRGILDIGYKLHAGNGRYYLLDPNPRLGCSFRLFVDSRDMDVLRAQYLDMTGQPVPEGQLAEGRKWLVEPFDLVSSWRYWRDGNLGLRDWIRSYRGVMEAQWFARDDMRPFWAVWKVSCLRALSRLGRRIRGQRAVRFGGQASLGPGGRTP